MSEESSNGQSVTIDPADSGQMTAVHPRDGASISPEEIVFEILVAVMWSDGELVRTEVQLGRAAAEAMQVRPHRGGVFGAIADGPLSFADIAFDRLDARSRRLAYAGACWIDDASAADSKRRRAFVAALRTRLGLDETTARQLHALALDVGRLHLDPRPAFDALVASVDRLPD